MGIKYITNPLEIKAFVEWQGVEGPISKKASVLARYFRQYGYDYTDVMLVITSDSRWDKRKNRNQINIRNIGGGGNAHVFVCKKTETS